ncbi:MAG: membrane protein insertion efficiency factor YidD [Arcobacter butzleri]|jgi:putative membrane protein insertion efficiency factor|nr:membrane protein insertion efficiency factor YidD [Arcobacteraceae bacterium]MDY0364978.1 membrane protein insertion efficiency factor YidD [Arcobacteraceae bacterium]NLO16921.1 membrane protein insertion efficiency factor YidD [Aliarcobacter butzleri]
MNRIFAYFIRFYQKYLSIFSHGSCRFYPTCSQYSQIHFENNSFFKASYHTITRILRCNQLFSGGFDHPEVLLDLKKIKISYKKVSIKYWYIPNGNGRFFVIKNWERNR